MPRIKLLFDECVGRPLVEGLARYFSLDPEGLEIAFVGTLFPGQPDAVWLPHAAAGEWIIVSADRGKTNNGVKLPRVCVELGLRHILFSSQLEIIRESVSDYCGMERHTRCSQLAPWLSLRPSLFQRRALHFAESRLKVVGTNRKPGPRVGVFLAPERLRCEDGLSASSNWPALSQANSSCRQAWH